MKASVLIITICCLYFGSFGQTTVQTIRTNELIKLVDSSTKPIIISFWATWCSPCLREIPWFEKAVAKRPADSIVLLLINIEGLYSLKAVESFVKKSAFKARVIVWEKPDIDELARILKIKWTEGIPATYMVNHPLQKMIFFNRQLTEAQIERELKNLTTQ